MILNGYGRGKTATLMVKNANDYTCDIRMMEKINGEKEILTVAYEDISKIFSE